MRILITNDDSIHAPGIKLVAEAAARLAEVTVVAPASECSAMSQKLTLREPMELRQVTDFPVEVRGAYALTGTPVDCVKVALSFVLEEKPDWVLSGINNGYNAGYDIGYSGTLGAAFEAARAGIPAMAFSIAAASHLESAREEIDRILRQLLETPPAPGAVWNVNFPPMRSRPLQGVLRDCTPAQTSLYTERYVPVREDDGTVLLECRGTPVPDSAFPEGTDAWAVKNGYISIGQVRSAPQ